MKKKYFGTDGIRGEVNQSKINGEMFFKFGLAGGIMGGLVGYIDSTDVAFDGREMGVFMVLMAILGGKGTLWGPIIGATIFHIFKEGFWTFFLGWQYVALGVLIVVIVIYFPEGIMGWLRSVISSSVSRSGSSSTTSTLSRFMTPDCW